MEVGGIQERGPGIGLLLGQSEATGLTLKGKGDSMIHIPPGPILCQPPPPIVSFDLAEIGEGWVQSCRSQWSLSERRGESFGPWVSTLLPGGWVTPPPPQCEASLT